ncbi:hypothetical protein ABT324_17905 [Saccharopolyspora sp. NPDC000359]|uniref:hypothetical protein n=1 Tax=Saccharopolyspora sp. NPDC000359 TaxID=3154251 RepID=UPI00331F90D7
MIAAGITFGLVAVVLAVWWAVRWFGEFGKHAGSGAGALTVQQLLDQAAAEDDAGGRHRLREPVVTRGDLALALAVAETRLLPLVETGLPVDDPAAMATHRWTLRRVCAGLREL